MCRLQGLVPVVVEAASIRLDSNVDGAPPMNDITSLVAASNQMEVFTDTMGRTRYRRPAPERFWSKVEFTDTCWLWTGAKTRGYGVFRMGSLRDGTAQNVVAHRFAYALTYGAISADLELDHLCRVRNCVNADHLEPVTHRENGLRGQMARGVGVAKTHCPQGHEYAERNLYVGPRGGRRCRRCRADGMAKRVAV